MPDAPVTGPLLLWLLVQLSALLVACLRLPLAAKYPQPAEMLAAQLVVVAQVVAASLLFPYLLRDRRAALAVVASAWPFIALGGVLSALPAGRVVAAGAYVTLWLTALAAMRHTLPDRYQPAGVTSASLITVGTPLLFYLRVEFGNADAIAIETQRVFEKWMALGPLPAALLQLSTHSNWRHWMIPTTLLAASLIALFGAQRSRQVIHNS